MAGIRYYERDLLDDRFGIEHEEERTGNLGFSMLIIISSNYSTYGIPTDSEMGQQK